MRDLLQSIAARGTTVFFTSHVLSAVEQIATQLIMIRKGRLVWDSPVAEVPVSLEQHYFDLVETPEIEDIEWLGSPQS